MLKRAFAGGLAAMLAAAIAMPSFADDAAPAATEPPPVPNARLNIPPKLIVAISVDQFSANLFAQYRQRFVGQKIVPLVNPRPKGKARFIPGGFDVLMRGAVFPSGYQSHAATETCPGHSTILTGMRPEHTGIIANNWYDPARPKPKIYCAEDENSTIKPDYGSYVPSAVHLKVPTLGEKLMAANPLSKNVAISGKDRGALMMGGNKTTAAVWWDDKAKSFRTYDGQAVSPATKIVNDALYRVVEAGSTGLPPRDCGRFDRAIAAGSTSVGTGRFAMDRGSYPAFKTSPRLDEATLDLAYRLIGENQLGQDNNPDVLSISLSATDYVGHAFGTEGPEMCIQMAMLNERLGKFIDQLNQAKLDYVIVLTADHGGFDVQERLVEQGAPQAQRALDTLEPGNLGDTISTTLRLGVANLLLGDGPAGDYYIASSVTGSKRDAVITEAKKLVDTNPQVAAVFSAKELQAAPEPKGSPDAWSLLDRAKASYLPGRSGDFVILLKPQVVAQSKPGPGYVATHGSPWDYDRRVPILFYRSGMTGGFEQSIPVETVDIVPTLLSLVKRPDLAAGLDGRCIDLDSGRYDFCKP